jgi:hypothetical protein
MGEGQRGLGLIFVSELSELRNDIHQLLLQKLQALCHHDDVRIVPHVTGSGPQMDNARRLGALLAICIHMAHDIVANFPFPGFRHFYIDVVRMGFHLLDLFVRDNRLAVLA